MLLEGQKEVRVNEYTKTHFRGYKETTKNRIALLACIDGLSYVKEGCEITIHIDSAYVTSSVSFLDKWQQEGLEQKKNSDLWKKYITAAGNHLIEFINEKENEYSRAMAVQRNLEKIVMLTDHKPEDEFK